MMNTTVPDYPYMCLLKNGILSLPLPLSLYKINSSLQIVKTSIHLFPKHLPLLSLESTNYRIKVMTSPSHKITQFFLYPWYNIDYFSIKLYNVCTIWYITFSKLPPPPPFFLNTAIWGVLSCCCCISILCMTIAEC